MKTQKRTTPSDRVEMVESVCGTVVLLALMYLVYLNTLTPAIK